MARSHLTLAAVATAAVPGLNLISAAPFGSREGGDFDSALLGTVEGHRYVIRVPQSVSAETEQSAELLAFQAFSQGIRVRLPFTVSRAVGQVAFDGTRAVVYDYLPGSPIGLFTLSANGQLAPSAAKALAAVHALPTDTVSDTGLPVLSAAEIRKRTAALLQRAEDSGVVPAALLDRWHAALSHQSLWQFVPTVIHGAVTEESLLSSDGNQVTGIVGWSGFSVGDPASDLFWLSSLVDHEARELVSVAYSAIMGTSGQSELESRAALYAELNLVKWLLHGLDSHDNHISNEAVAMLDQLVDSEFRGVLAPLTPAEAGVLPVASVQQLLVDSEGALGATEDGVQSRTGQTDTAETAAFSQDEGWSDAGESADRESTDSSSAGSESDSSDRTPAFTGDDQETTEFAPTATGLAPSEPESGSDVNSDSALGITDNPTSEDDFETDVLTTEDYSSAWDAEFEAEPESETGSESEPESSSDSPGDSTDNHSDSRS